MRKVVLLISKTILCVWNGTILLSFRDNYSPVRVPPVLGVGNLSLGTTDLLGYLALYQFKLVLGSVLLKIIFKLILFFYLETDIIF